MIIITIMYHFPVYHNSKEFILAINKYKNKKKESLVRGKKVIYHNLVLQFSIVKITPIFILNYLLTYYI